MSFLETEGSGEPLLRSCDSGATLPWNLKPIWTKRKERRTALVPYDCLDQLSSILKDKQTHHGCDYCCWLDPHFFVKIASRRTSLWLSIIFDSISNEPYFSTQSQNYTWSFAIREQYVDRVSILCKNSYAATETVSG